MHAAWPTESGWLWLRGVDDGSPSLSLLEAFVCKVPEDPLLCVTGLILLIVLHCLLFIHLTRCRVGAVPKCVDVYQKKKKTE